MYRLNSTKFTKNRELRKKNVIRHEEYQTRGYIRKIGIKKIESPGSFQKYRRNITGKCRELSKTSKYYFQCEVKAIFSALRVDRYYSCPMQIDLVHVWVNSKRFGSVYSMQYFVCNTHHTTFKQRVG